VTEYATESPVSLRRRRQRRRALITIGTVLLGLFFAFWYALSYYQSDGPSAPAAASATPTCQPVDPEALTPDKITVRVLNATNRAGLAASTAKKLGDLGFTISGADNDTSDRDAPSVAEVRHGPSGADAAAVVLTYLPDGSTVFDDKRKDNSIDVVLGEKFSSPVSPEASPGALPPCPAPSAA
jgi:hypothetical protein